MFYILIVLELGLYHIDLWLYIISYNLVLLGNWCFADANFIQFLNGRYSYHITVQEMTEQAVGSYRCDMCGMTLTLY